MAIDVIAVNSSPKMGKGNTSIILSPFIAGLREAGADVEEVFTEALTIHPCRGCIRCWVKTPGICFQDDAMRELLPKLSTADLWVFASPLYMDSITGSLKNLIDRMSPLAEPFMELREGRNRHVNRKELKPGKLVLVTNCGFWEIENFDPLLSFIKAFCLNFEREFSGALFRPHGPAMRFAAKEKVASVIEAAREAGRELVSQGSMSSETLALVSQELLSRDAYIDHINQGFEGVLRERGLMDLAPRA